MPINPEPICVLNGITRLIIIKITVGQLNHRRYQVYTFPFPWLSEIFE